MNNSIANINIYLSRMQCGMDDKLWWVTKTPVKKVVDFGCADGTLLKHLRDMNVNYELIGVDVSEEMCKRASENVPEARIMHTSEFFNNNENWQDAILILSSVVHEIYSYEESPEALLQKLFKMGFYQIAIRDMFLSETEANKSVSYHDCSNVVNYSNDRQLSTFESHWGHVGVHHNFCHFLLKYLYKENWDREVRENYLPIDLEPFLRTIPDSYTIEHVEHYCHPYIKERVLQDFFINFHERTHAKILLTRKYGRIN